MEVKVKNIFKKNVFITKSVLLYKMLIYGLEFMDYLWIIVIAVCCLDSHSDGTHSLQMIHWWASDVMLNFLNGQEFKWRKGLSSYEQTHNKGKVFSSFLDHAILILQFILVCLAHLFS